MPTSSHRAPGQLSFLDNLGGDSGADGARLAWDLRLRTLLAGAIKSSRYSREEIARRMSEASGERVTRAMLDGWTATSKPHRFPLSLLPSFCHAVGNHDVVSDLVAMVGGHFASREDLALAELGRLYRRRRETSRRERALMDLLEGSREP